MFKLGLIIGVLVCLLCKLVAHVVDLKVKEAVSSDSVAPAPAAVVAAAPASDESKSA